MKAYNPFAPTEPPPFLGFFSCGCSGDQGLQNRSVDPGIPQCGWPSIRPINQPEGPVCVPDSRVLGWGCRSSLRETDNRKVRKLWEEFGESLELCFTLLSEKKRIWKERGASRPCFKDLETLRHKWDKWKKIDMLTVEEMTEKSHSVQFSLIISLMYACRTKDFKISGMTKASKDKDWKELLPAPSKAFLAFFIIFGLSSEVMQK